MIRIPVIRFIGTALVDSTITAESGSYSITGQDANLLKGSEITAEAGSYAVTGQDATLTISTVITAEAGSYTVTGQDASLIHDGLISAEAGSYVLTGQDATLTFSGVGAFLIDAESGSYAITGTDAGLLHDSLISAESGSYSVTGQDATLSKGIILDAESGSYTVTGQDVTFLKDSVLSADSGVYTITGQDVDLIYSEEEAEEEQVTGGWFRKRWIPTKEEIKKKREELGITRKEADQISRIAKKVIKKQVQPSKASEIAKEYFKEQKIDFEPKHRKVVDELVVFLRQFAPSQTEIGPRKSRTKDKNQVDSTYQELVDELKLEAQLKEEKDMVFIITMLAA